MKCFDNGCFYTVSVTPKDVAEFRAKWPCNGMTDKSVWFQFDKRNGDLVDTNDSTHHPSADGGAMLALSHDAQTYGAKRLKL